MAARGPSAEWSHSCKQAVEYLEQRIDDRLAKRVRCFGDLLVTMVTGGQREIPALLGDDRLGPLDRPLGEVAAVGDG